MRLDKYLSELDVETQSTAQQEWDVKLRNRISYFKSVGEKPVSLYHEFERRLRTEEIKAWYSCPDSGDLFQGTSVSSLVIPALFERPLELNNMNELEDRIADHYILAHDKYVDAVLDAIVDPVEDWIREGLFYGIVLPSKVVSQALNFAVDTASLVIDVKGNRVDPHEITSYPMEIREEYFKNANFKIEPLSDLKLSKEEFESSLVLADVSKPNIARYKNKALLGPVRCNEIASLMARHIKKMIIAKTQSRIKPRSLAIVIYDTDTPYTYHQVMGYNGNQDAPCLPGLIVLGSSGSIDAFRWLYSYRVSLISQKIMKGSLHSQTKSSFVPFIFMGVLVPRDAQILLDMERLDLLRYKGNISPSVEFSYLANDLLKYINKDKT